MDIHVASEGMAGESDPLGPGSTEEEPLPLTQYYHTTCQNKMKTVKIFRSCFLIVNKFWSLHFCGFEKEQEKFSWQQIF